MSFSAGARRFGSVLKGAIPSLPKTSLLSSAKQVPSVLPSTFAAARSFSTKVDPNYEVSSYTSKDGLFEANEIEAGDTNRRAFTYLMLGSARFLYASTVRIALVKFVSSMSASADVLALSTLEVDLSKIDMGTTTTVKWRGKPVFIRRRSEKEIAGAAAVSVTELKDPETDAERVQNPEFLVVLGVCTHLGCVPISNAGDYHGWFCPCHGSHYDTSGRIRKGPAPLNLEVPTYSFMEGGSKLLIG